MTPRVLVILPAHNEAGSIAEVLLGLRAAAPRFDRVVVDDGSRDGTGEIVDRLGERRLTLACNLGSGWALRTGLLYAMARSYDIAVFIDADGQHDPRDVPRLVSVLMEKGADLVLGSRFGGGRRYTGSLPRGAGQWLFSQLARAMLGRRIVDTTSGFKAVRATAFPVLVGGSFLDFHMEALLELIWRGFSVVELPITVSRRRHGRSMHTFVSLIQYPAKTLFLTLVAAVNAAFQRRAS